MWLFFYPFIVLLMYVIQSIHCQDSSNASLCKSECPEPYNPDFARAGIILHVGSSKAKFDGNLVLNCSFARAILEHNQVFDDKRAPFTTMAVLRYTDVNNPREFERELCWQISNFNILGGHMAPATLAVIDAYTRTLGVPYITTSLSPKELYPNQNFDFTWSLKPSLVLPLLDIITRYSPERVAYLYANEEAFLRYQNLKSNLSNSYMNSTIFKKITGNIRDDIQSLRDKGWTFYVVDAPVRITQTVLDNAALLGMVTFNFHFVVVNLNANKLKVNSFIYGGMNLTAFQLPVNQSNSRLFNLTVNCSDRTNIKNNVTIDRPDADAILLHDLSLVLLNAFETVLAKYSYMPVSQRSQCFCSRFFDSKCCSRLRKNECLMSCCCLQKLAESSVDAHGCTQGRTYISAFQEMIVDGLSGSIQFDNVTGERTSYTLQVIGIKDSEFIPIATWKSDRSVRLQFANFTEDSVDNKDEVEILKQRELIVTSILDKPFLMRKDDEDKNAGNEQFEGYCADLLTYLANKIHFKYRIKIVADQQYGSNNTGTWNGMVGEVMTGKADMAVAGLTINAEREKAVLFTKPFMNIGISIMYNKPHHSTPGIFSFLKPLQANVWTCVVFAYVGVTVVLYLVTRISPSEWNLYEVEPETCSQKSANSKESPIYFNMYNSVWFSFGALMQQGGEVTPRSVGGRLVGAVWWFFTLIFIASYTANLAAFLTIEVMIPAFNSVDDLANQSIIKYGAVINGSTMDFFKNSKTPVLMKIWDGMRESSDNFVADNKEGVERVRHSKGKYAFFLESSVNEFNNQREPCDTMKIGPNLDSKGYGVAFSKERDWLRKHFTIAILELRENGTLLKLENKWWYHNSECVDASKPRRRLNMTNLGGVFYILIVGLFVSMVVAILQFCWKSKAVAKKRRTPISVVLKEKARLSVTGEGLPLTPQYRDTKAALTPPSMRYTPSTTSTLEKKETVRQLHPLIKAHNFIYKNMFVCFLNSHFRMSCLLFKNAVYIAYSFCSRQHFISPTY
ncbi:glutamate receptor 4-like isoform X2 [Antedon mediterranea]|uniref:glutamate receptor 4-like isoform X2 n=1 Tax=Antedon mediterranea TaxID=105859 RepID=UPI003AF457EB